MHHRVLVIDDDPEAAELMAGLVTALGHAAHVAHDAASGLQLMVKLHPTLVLLDLLMPGISGFDAAHASGCSAKAPAFRSSRVTGMPRHQIGDRAALAGVRLVLSKPLSAGQRAEPPAAADFAPATMRGPDRCE